MLATDLSTNPSTAIGAGTSAAMTHSLLSAVKGQSVRSAAAVATTNPSVITISHQTRTLKNLKTVANPSVPAPDVIFDRHLVRLDSNVVQTAILDPNYLVNRSVYLVIESPRLNSDTPDATDFLDDIKRLVSMLDASSGANMVRILNGET